MQSLLEQYRRVGLWMFGLATFGVAIIYKVLLPAIESNEEWQWLVLLLTASGLYGIVYTGGLYVYIKIGWRILNPHLDHRGTWYSFTIQTSGESVGKIVSKGEAAFRQDALSISLGGTSTATTKWEVESISYDKEFKGLIVYKAATGNPPCGAGFNRQGVGRFHSDHLPLVPGPSAGRVRTLVGQLRVAFWFVIGTYHSPNQIIVFDCTEWYMNEAGMDYQRVYYTRREMTDDEAMYLHQAAQRHSMAQYYPAGQPSKEDGRMGLLSDRQQSEDPVPDE